MQTTAIFCNVCGFNSASDAQFCQRCGAGLGPSLPPTSFASVAAPHYGGFWIRVVASVLDFVLMFIAFIPVRILLGSMVTIAAMNALLPMHEFFVLRRAIRIAVAIAFNFIYRTAMESSRFQATFGKLAVGLKITDEHGNPISFSRAIGRYSAKWLSLLALGLGYAMAGFDGQKQALHDRIAGTLVMYRR